MKSQNELKENYCVDCLRFKKNDCENCVIDQMFKIYRIIEALQEDVKNYGTVKIMPYDFCPDCCEQKRLQGLPIDCSSCVYAEMMNRQHFDTREML